MNKKYLKWINKNYDEAREQLDATIRNMIIAIVEDMSDDERCIKYWEENSDFTTPPDEIIYLTKEEKIEDIVRNYNDEQIVEWFKRRFGFSKKQDTKTIPF